MRRERDELLAKNSIPSDFEEVKYSCEVHSNGAVRDVDKDYARGIFEKVELFFEVLFYNLFNR